MLTALLLSALLIAGAHSAPAAGATQPQPPAPLVSQESVYTFTPHQQLTPKLDLIRDLQLLGSLRQTGTLRLNDEQVQELNRTLGGLLKQDTLSLRESAALRRAVLNLLNPQQLGGLEAARRKADEQAGLRLSQMRLPAEDGLRSRTLWRYALSIGGGLSLTDSLKADPDLNPYLHWPYRAQLLRLLEQP